MATFGKFEVVTELHTGERGTVFSARPAGGGREVKYAVKSFNSHALDSDEQFWETQSFVERAKVQQRVGEAEGSHWAPVYEIGSSPVGTYYVTDFHPLSAASLVAGRVEVSAGVLYSIVRSVVAGLAELKAVAARAHGNLKPTNVLINSRGDVTVAGAVLTDPASGPDAANAGESGDLFALGGLIHLLVLGRPFVGGSDWPPAPARAWLRLGRRQGRLWRKLCADLLSPDPSQRPAGVDAVAKRLKRLVPGRARPSRRLSLAVAAAVVVVAAGAATLLGLRDAGARREVCAAKERWAGSLTAALAEPRRRMLMESDPDLVRVVRELDKAQLGSFDCGGGGRLGFNPDIRKFRQTQETLEAVRRAERGLSPIQWQQLRRAAELQGKFEARGWDKPAQHLARRIASARPGSDNLAEGIERFLVAMAALDRNLPAVEEEWLGVQTRTRALDDTRDPLMRAFAAHLRSAAAASVELTDGGFASLGRLGMRDASQRAEDLFAAYTRLRNEPHDEERFKGEILARIDVNRIQPADIERYVKSLPAYRVPEDQVKLAVAELRKEAAKNEKAVRDSGVDPTSKDFADRLSIVNYRIQRFGEDKHIPRDFVDGVFQKKKQQVAADVQLLLGFIPVEDVNVWKQRLLGEKVTFSSEALRDYWQSWTDGISETVERYAGQRDEIKRLQAETRKLLEVLSDLDRAMPQVPKELADPVLAEAASHKREELMGGVVKDRPPIAFVREPDVPVAESPAVKQAAAAFTQWTRDLSALARDFRLPALLTPDVRPDEKWAAANPGFWNDRIVRTLVSTEVARLNALRAVGRKPRQELLKASQGEDSAERALHAWRLLGAEPTSPPWPTRAGELEAEAKVRQRLFEMLAALPQSDEVNRAVAELNDQGPVRWRRFAEGAGADEAMLGSAFELREAFGADRQQFAALPPEARFNLALLELRRQVGDVSEQKLAPLVADLRQAAADLKDPAVAGDLATRLARIGEKDAFPDAARGDEFVLRPDGPDLQIRFRRVKPRGGRPFFLATTELSFAQFAAIVAANSAWDDLRELVWSPQPGEIGDPRRGPRVWEWALRPAPQMYPTTLWYFADDANDFPKELRDPRLGKFNKAALADAVGGTPGERHPVQYVSPEAALYVAGLAGCRLPTPAEWRAAYEGFEKDVPAEQWNLRDQTWLVQRDYAAAHGDSTRGAHSPDEGIYLPPTPKVATGSGASAHRQRDGTVFFRPVEAPGGSTFRHLVGNVAELVCDAPEPFERLADHQLGAVKAFASDASMGLYVIGGSALSPPEMTNDVPHPVKPDAAYADVGFRLAFSAPPRNLAEKLEWVLAGQGFVQPAERSKTARAEAPQRP